MVSIGLAAGWSVNDILLMVVFLLSAAAIPLITVPGWRAGGTRPGLPPHCGNRGWLERPPAPPPAALSHQQSALLHARGAPATEPRLEGDRARPGAPVGRLPCRLGPPGPRGRDLHRPDPSLRYCYKASKFSQLGYTSGYARGRGHFVATGREITALPRTAAGPRRRRPSGARDAAEPRDQPAAPHETRRHPHDRRRPALGHLGPHRRPRSPRSVAAFHLAHLRAASSRALLCARRGQATQPPALFAPILPFRSGSGSRSRAQRAAMGPLWAADFAEVPAGYLAAGVAAFSVGKRTAKRRGTLGRY